MRIAAADAILGLPAVQEAFLPGMGEIRRAADSLPGAIKPNLHILHSSDDALN